MSAGDTRVVLGNAEAQWADLLEEAARALFADGSAAVACPECGDRDYRTGRPMAHMPQPPLGSGWLWLPGPCVLIYCGRCPEGRRPLVGVYHPTHARNTEGPAARRLPVEGVPK